MNELKPIREIKGATSADLTEELLTGQEPLVLRGLAADWPFVKAGRKSAADARAYLKGLYNGTEVIVSYAGPEAGGKPFYKDDMSGLNFDYKRIKLDMFLDLLESHEADEKPPFFYVGSTTIGDCLPGFGEQNSIPLGDRDCIESIWIGNRTHIAAHYDLADNVACVAAGKRRFTLFPPDQLPNLYVGPLDFTPAGQPVSMVDLHNPAFDRFPRFRDALAVAQVAELEAGDAIFIPSMWWHAVDGLAAFNVLVNYWWRQSPSYMGPANNALQLALLAIRDLPADQKKIWQQIFNHYVFENTEETTAHIPERGRGVLGPMTDDNARRIRAFLLNGLNR
ncbi:Cupin-like domain-containing protein [Kordiimonas lacus]|uniref:Cupin-like domain-containing protein n=2 Tax=Kordiimonas lacus TaxID=637679 RepID=A0A1G7D9W2_9PROT|nr:cupin-like domain-containing protein [Kordiimonas lacus]SDE47770.1 Cupin-like domain-containing protein [Kordiimonas lacus]